MIEILDKKHNKKEFDCGKDSLNHYIQQQAGQDVKRKLAVCFVMADEDKHLVKGYYTLSNNSIPLDAFPPDVRKKLPGSYHNIPTTLLGRLAIDKKFQGMGIGKLLLIDALKKSYEIAGDIGSFAVVVDPIDKDAELFYEKYGFIKLPDSEKIFIAMKTIQSLFAV